jgi:hypothetical protein
VRRPLLHPRRNTAIGVFRAPQEDRTQSPAFPELAQLEFSVIPDGRKSALNHNRTLTRVTAGHRKAPGAVRMDIDIMSSARPAHLTRVSTAQRPDPRDVSHSADQTSDLFEQAPPDRIQLRLKLVAPGERRVRLRAGMVVLIGWLPLALLSLAYEPMFWRGSFFADMGAQARSLIAAPLLVLAEGACAPRLGVIVRHFVDSGWLESASTAASRPLSIRPRGCSGRPGRSSPLSSSPMRRWSRCSIRRRSITFPPGT